MEFTLYYRGELKANRGPKDKHVLRRHFHRQLKELWLQLPLRALEDYIMPNNPRYPERTIIRPVGAFECAPLICEAFWLTAELHITMLRPEPPGRIVTQAGDIDNRLKTLLDGLTMPRQADALPPGAIPLADESPFYCLLEDDNLITSITVQTDRLLEPVAHQSEVVLLIRVRTRPTLVFGDNAYIL